MHTAITIRPAAYDDIEAVARLAALDSAAVPPAPWLLAEERGVLRAALSTSSGAAVADPFVMTASMLALLRAAAEADAASRRAGRRLPTRPHGWRLRRRLRRPILAPR